MGLIEKIIGLFSRRPPTADASAGPQQIVATQPIVRPAPPSFSSPAPGLADRRYLAELRRYEVETDEIAAAIRDKDERRKHDRIDQWLLFGLIVVAAVALLVTDEERWSPYLSPALIAGAVVRLIWMQGSRTLRGQQ